MESNEGGINEAVELEEARDTGPRWAELDEEASRNQRVDLLALWCRRLAGLLVWSFVGFIFAQLWQVAWEMKDLKLMGVCLLVTLSLIYALVKRYQHIRETGLTGIELMRALATDALAVDNNGGVRLRGVTPKARAMCVDFKYDPQGTFRERSAGCGFEVYPPPSELSSSSSFSSTTLTSMSAMMATASGGEGERKEEEEEGALGLEAAVGSRKNRRRRRGKWPWAWRRGTGGETPTGQGSDGRTAYAEAKTDEESPITREGEGGRIDQQQATKEPSRDGRGSNSSSTGNDIGAFSGEAVGQPRPASTPPPPDFGAGAPRDGEEEGGGRRRQVIRASELSASCSVCLYDYFPDEAVTLLPCAHLYHTECIDIWMRDHVECPYCRADMNVWCNSGGPSSGVSSTTNPTAPTTAAPAAATTTTTTADSYGYPIQETAGSAAPAILEAGAAAAASNNPSLWYAAPPFPLPSPVPGDIGRGVVAGERGEGGAAPATGTSPMRPAPAGGLGS